MTYQPNQWQPKRARRRSRATRWFLLLAIAVTLGVTIAALILPGDPSHPPVFIPQLSILVVLGAGMSPFALNSYLTKHGFEAYDEFERAALNDAIRRSYLIVVIAFACASAWLIGADNLGLPLPTHPRQWLMIGYAALMCVAALPVTIAEFTVPMPDPDDDPI